MLNKAATRIPYVGALVSSAIESFNSDIKKPDCADMIIQVKTKLTPKKN